MKAIVVRQPWATLIALGVKTIETRPSPPNGPMRPEGVRGLPGCSLERGERIAIVAGAAKPAGLPVWTDLAVGKWTTTGVHAIDPETQECPCPDPEDGAWSDECEALNDWTPALLRDERAHGFSFVAPLPLGSVVCMVTVDDALRITDEMLVPERHLWLLVPEYPMLCESTDAERDESGGRRMVGLEEEFPLGHFTPGRWGWLLTDPTPCDPIPCGRAQGLRSSQGVFELPADIAEALS